MPFSHLLLLSRTLCCLHPPCGSPYGDWGAAKSLCPVPLRSKEKMLGKGPGDPLPPHAGGQEQLEPYSGMLDLGAGKRRAQSPSWPWELAPPLLGGCGKALLRAGACRIWGGGMSWHLLGL